MLLVLRLQTSYATTTIPGPFKGIKLEPLTDLTTEGPVRMSLMFFPKGDYGDTLSFQVVGTQGLVSIGPDIQTISANEDGSFATEFQIRIPDNDTSSLTIQVFPLSPFSEQKCWFVTTECTVEYWKDHPRTYNGPFRSDPPVGRRGRIIPGEFPDLDSIYGIPPEMIHPLYREQAAGGDRQLFYPGRAVIEVDCYRISLPDNVRGIVFDTLRNIRNTHNLPKWSFLGPLRVDSLVTRQGRVPLERQSQLDGIILGPAELLNVFSDVRVRTLFKSYPDRVPEDTLLPDRVRVQQHTPQSRSRFYRIDFSQSDPLDSAIKKLQSVPGVGVGYVGIPAQ